MEKKNLKQLVKKKKRRDYLQRKEQRLAQSQLLWHRSQKRVGYLPKVERKYMPT